MRNTFEGEPNYDFDFSIVEDVRRHAKAAFHWTVQPEGLSGGSYGLFETEEEAAKSRPDLAEKKLNESPNLTPQQVEQKRQYWENAQVAELKVGEKYINNGFYIHGKNDGARHAQSGRK
jgi:hypothetical protein